MQILQEIAAHSDLTFNYKKSVLLRSPAAGNGICFLTGDRLKPVTQSKCLRVILRADPPCKTDVTTKLAKAQKLFNTCTSSDTGLSVAWKLRIYDAVFVPMLDHVHLLHKETSPWHKPSATQEFELSKTSPHSRTTSAGHISSCLVTF